MRLLKYHTFYVIRCSLILVPLLILISCGKKAPPTIKAYAKPSAPAGLTALHREDKMMLFWSYPDNLRSSLKDFQVLRSAADGFERIGSVGSSQSSFVDDSFALDVTYNYKVLAQSQKGIQSDDSNIITVTPRAVPPPPDDVRFSVGADGVVLSWMSSGEGVCYNIFRSAEKGKYGEGTLNREPVCEGTFKDGLVATERSVYYTVRALRETDLRDEGYPSQEVEVNPSHFVPSPPSDLRLVKSEKVYLMWKESSAPWVRGYRVYRRKEGETGFTLIGQVIKPSFTDAEKTDQKVWYMIRAVGPAGESEPLVGQVQ